MKAYKQYIHLPTQHELNILKPDLRPVELKVPGSYLGCGGHGAGHLHLRVHDLGLHRHGGDFGADGECAVLLLPQLDQLLSENLTCLLVTTPSHLLDFCLLEGGEQNLGYKDLTGTKTHVSISSHSTPIACKF